MIVVAGHEHDVAIAQDRPELGEERARHVEHARDRALAEVDDVPQQHDPVGVLELRPQPGAHVGATQEVATRAHAQVQVRQDDRRHGARFSARIAPPLVAAVESLQLADVAPAVAATR